MDHKKITELINKCNNFMVRNKTSSIHITLSEILTYVCKYGNIEYGFIGEKIYTEEDVVALRYHAIYGFDASSYINSYEKNKHCDFFPTGYIHEKILNTKKHLICNSISKMRNNKPMPKNHPEMETFCAFPMINTLNDRENVFGVVGFARKKNEFTDDEIDTFLLLIECISNIFINVKNISDSDNHKINFIANLSHEVRTPLNSIITMTDMLMTTNLTQKQQDYSESVKMCGVQLMDILNDILDYSKLVSNSMKLKKIPFSLNKCIQSVFFMMKHDADEKKIILDYIIENNVPDMIVSDIVRIKQILLNVLNNAIKFTKTGHVKLFVQKLTKSDSTCDILFCVKDTGCGMSEEKISKIFDSYRNTDKNYLNNLTGVGLGLSITKQLVNLFEGSIWIESKVNKGTIVNMKMPLTIFNTYASSENLEAYYTNKKALLFNLNFDEQKNIFMLLETYKMKVTVLTNENNILTYLSNHRDVKYEFIILNGDVINTQNMNKIYKFKNDITKIIIVNEYENITVGNNIHNKQNGLFLFDHKIIRPIDKNKISYLLSILHDEIQNQFKNIHNEIIIDNEKHKISNINPNLDQNIQDIIINNDIISILVAEDNKQNQQVLCELLNLIGYYNICVVDDGFEAYTKMINDDFDIIFMDLKMPIMSGIDATIKFKETSEKNPKIIAVTASLSDEVKKKCFDAQMDGFITKPIDKKNLESIMSLLKNNIL